MGRAPGAHALLGVPRSGPMAERQPGAGPHQAGTRHRVLGIPHRPQACRSPRPVRAHPAMKPLCVGTYALVGRGSLQDSESAHVVLSVDEICCHFSQNLYLSQKKKKNSQKQRRSSGRSRPTPSPTRQTGQALPALQTSSLEGNRFCPVWNQYPSVHRGHFLSNGHSIAFLNPSYPRASHG